MCVTLVPVLLWLQVGYRMFFRRRRTGTPEGIFEGMKPLLGVISDCLPQIEEHGGIYQDNLWRPRSLFCQSKVIQLYASDTGLTL